MLHVSSETILYGLLILLESTPRDRVSTVARQIALTVNAANISTKNMYNLNNHAQQWHEL